MPKFDKKKLPKKVDSLLEKTLQLRNSRIAAENRESLERPVALYDDIKMTEVLHRMSEISKKFEDSMQQTHGYRTMRRVVY